MAEFNLIQAPELIRRLTKRLGLRQPHITPSLNEGVQAVVILDDVRDADTLNTEEQTPSIVNHVIFLATVAGSEQYVNFANQTTQRDIWRLRAMSFGVVGATHAAGSLFRLGWRASVGAIIGGPAPVNYGSATYSDSLIHEPVTAQPAVYIPSGVGRMAGVGLAGLGTGLTTTSILVRPMVQGAIYDVTDEIDDIVLYPWQLDDPAGNFGATLLLQSLNVGAGGCDLWVSTKWEVSASR